MSKHSFLPLLWLLVFGYSTILFGQAVVLNEVVASNSIYQDEDGDTPDWFELYNPTAEPQSLSGWYITDDPAIPDQWAFPDITLPANPP